MPTALIIFHKTLYNQQLISRKRCQCNFPLDATLVNKEKFTCSTPTMRLRRNIFGRWVALITQILLYWYIHFVAYINPWLVETNLLDMVIVVLSLSPRLQRVPSSLAEVTGYWIFCQSKPRSPIRKPWIGLTEDSRTTDSSWFWLGSVLNLKGYTAVNSISASTTYPFYNRIPLEHCVRLWK